MIDLFEFSAWSAIVWLLAFSAALIWVASSIDDTTLGLETPQPIYICALHLAANLTFLIFAVVVYTVFIWLPLSLVYYIVGTFP